MATVNFSVPEKVKQAFNRVFKGENKSAVLARLMRQAVDERRRQKRRALAVDALLRLRARTRRGANEAIGRERRIGRP